MDSDNNAPCFPLAGLVWLSTKGIRLPDEEHLDSFIRYILNSLPDTKARAQCLYEIAG